MIKSLLGKINKKDENVSPEILELRKKFAELDAIGKKPTSAESQPSGRNKQENPSSVSSNVPDQHANQVHSQSQNNPNHSATEASSGQPAAVGQQYASVQNQGQPGSVSGISDENVVVNLKHTVPTKKEVKIKLIDAEQAEQDERMTNLIMEQIKELIEIDDNLNTKIKELSGQITDLKEELEKTQKENKKAMDRMNIIESNMEKFMALYEVVTNQYNPFVSKESVQSAQSQSSPSRPQDYSVKNTSKESIESGGAKTQEDSRAHGHVKDESQNARENSGPVNSEASTAEGDRALPSGNSTGQAPSDNSTSSAESSTKSQAVQNSAPSQALSAGTPDDKKLPAGTPETTPASSSPQESPQEMPVIVDKIDQSASLADLIETRINNVLADFKASFRKELYVDIDKKITEMVQGIEKSLNRQLSSVVRSHIEEELRDKLGKILETESPHLSHVNPPPGQTEKIPPNPSDSVLHTGNSSDSLSAHQEVHPDNYFWLPDGRPVRNLAELAEELSVMDESIFSQHVSHGKNDFAEWVRHVIKNEDLARHLEAASSKSEMLQAVRSALEK